MCPVYKVHAERRSELISCVLLITILAGVAPGEKMPYANTEIVPPTPAWTATVESNAPAQPTVPTDKRKLLVFSLSTGYDHKVIPYVDRVFQILGDKSGSFDTTITVDIEMLMPDQLARYDVMLLNNNCSVGPRRNLLLDELERNPKYRELTTDERQAKSDSIEQSLLEFVAGGKGIVAIHGAPAMLNSSPRFSEMIGGAFDYHPPNQEVTIRPVDEDHPLVAAFCGKGPFIHRDEPYCFDGPYEKLNFRPLLSMDVDGIRDSRGRVRDIVRYVAWIKPHGKGRVFYCSPSHFPESYQSATVLQFLLDGVQYAAGDLDCDDSTPSSLEPR